MDQQFACPHCRQALTLPRAAAARQVQCPHCSGLFVAPAFEPFQAPFAGGTHASAATPAPAGQAHENPSNLKYLVAGAILLAMMGVPLLAYGLIRLSSAPRATAVASGAVAQPQSAPKPKGVVLSGTVIMNDAASQDEKGVAARDRVRRSATAGSLGASTKSGGSGTPAPATAHTARSPMAGSPGSRPAISSSQTAADSTEIAQAKSGAPADTTSLVQQIEPSVVVVQVTREKGSGIGSGFPLDDQGTIVTNYHVIEGAKSIKIKFGQKTADVGGFLVFSPGKDIALLKANLGPEKVSPLRLAANKPAKGETVLTFGAPLGFDSTVSNGIVSSVRKGTELQDIFKNMSGSDIYVDEQHYDLDAVWVQTTAPISGGNSGGPLVNLKGEVVGLNTWHLVSGQNMNFAISADHIKELMKSAISGVHPFSELPKPRERSFAAGNAKRTLEYWDEVSRINRSLAARLKKIRQPPIPNTKAKLAALFPKLVGIYKKMGEMLPEAAGKLKALKIDDIDEELVGLVTVDAMYLEKIGEEARDLATDIKLLRAEKVTIYDYEKLSKKAYGKFQDLELGQAYDVLRIQLTSRYGLTFASIFDASARSKSDDKTDGDDAADDKSDTAGGTDSQREKQATSKLKLAKQLRQVGKKDAAKERLQQIVDDYGGTKAAEEAQKLLDELGAE